jgi:hypothetical protein
MGQGLLKVASSNLARGNGHNELSDRQPREANINATSSTFVGNRAP